MDWKLLEEGGHIKPKTLEVNLNVGKRETVQDKAEEANHQGVDVGGML